MEPYPARDCQVYHACEEKENRSAPCRKVAMRHATMRLPRGKIAAIIEPRDRSVRHIVAGKAGLWFIYPFSWTHSSLAIICSSVCRLDQELLPYQVEDCGERINLTPD